MFRSVISFSVRTESKSQSLEFEGLQISPGGPFFDGNWKANFHNDRRLHAMFHNSSYLFQMFKRNLKKHFTLSRFSASFNEVNIPQTEVHHGSGGPDELLGIWWPEIDRWESWPLWLNRQPSPEYESWRQLVQQNLQNNKIQNSDKFANLSWFTTRSRIVAVDRRKITPASTDGFDVTLGPTFVDRRRQKRLDSRILRVESFNKEAGFVFCNFQLIG